MKKRISQQSVSFEESFLNIDIAKACAIYNLDNNDVELTKENVEEKTDRYLKTIAYNSEHPNYFKSTLRVIALKCKIDNVEIGYAVIDDYEQFENISFIFIHKKFRLLGYAEKLFNHCINQNEKYKVVQADENDIKNTGTLLKRFGFNHRTSSLFDFELVLKEEELSALEIIHNTKQFKLMQDKADRFKSSKLEMMTIFADVKYGKEKNPTVKLSKILERFPNEEIDFLKVLQSEYKETEYFYLVINNIIELYQQN